MATECPTYLFAGEMAESTAGNIGGNVTSQTNALTLRAIQIHWNSDCNKPIFPESENF